ncbi:undecaprenyl-diphosphate phosphatase [Methylophaga thiooxydans]|uniref:Undecaprenyl-diphosphatase n=1 Tax=Methylophaga thiooxydans DMS010 TaxID=637616 RepID=C0N2M8_9GAMM|nr:undecaprenyl-diphosphate phosphatase [Methylophaga thiooxydans]EEF80970.1 undecaprenol kinase, putative [Methylophaga thiooxydans DMS010]
MDFIQVFALALLQGLTEFLPISSSAHLILLPIIANWQDQGLAFDVAVHVGTLTAVVFYFRSTLKKLTADWFTSVATQKNVGDSRLAWAVLFGTIPVGLAGLLMGDWIETALRSPIVIAITTIGFGLLLGYADWQGKRVRSEQSLNWQDVLFIGVAQAVALIPGTSRSGITITAGLMLGLTREAAARFSFLLSIPVILLAGGLKTIELVQSPLRIDWAALVSGALFSAISAYICIFLFLKMLDRIGMWPFVIYRLVLGGFLLWLFL